MDLISVILPAYNQEKSIEHAIYSVLQQSWKNLELIVVDDGSTDRTADKVKQVKDSRVRYFYQQHQGRAAARNRGIDESLGDYIAFQCGDGSWHPSKLEKQMAFLEETKADAVQCACLCKKRIPADEEKPDGLVQSMDVLTEEGLPLESMLIRIRCLICDRPDDAVNSYQDAELMLRLVQQWRVVLLNQVLCQTQSHDVSETSADKVVSRMFDTMRMACKKDQTAVQGIQQEYGMLYQQYAALQQQYATLQQQCRSAEQQYLEATNQYNSAMGMYQSVITSDSWKITKPVRKMSDVFRACFRGRGEASFVFRGLQSIKNNGVKTTLHLAHQHFHPVAATEEVRITAPVQEMKPILTCDPSPDYEENVDFTGYTTDIKTLALYLPQFHTFPENDAWWGKGFTEWTNVRKGRPRYEEHDQPRIPHDDFGYYDLSDVETLKKQVQLAKAHGVYGFAIYYYWFSGHRLLEKPLELLLEHKEIDMPFMAVWANENWTRTWDGLENDVLIRQNYTKKDPKNFISDIKKYVEDKRYIRVDGKPVIGLYAPSDIPDVKHVLKRWRKEAQAQGIGDILIWVCMGNSSAAAMGVAECVDAQYEFPPRGKGHIPNWPVPDHGIVYDYKALVEEEHRFTTTETLPTYRGIMLDWDNSARKASHYNAWVSFTLHRFYMWTRLAVQYTREHFDADRRFLFVNAWNEWGEGTYLEPDKKMGYARINTLSRAVFDLPFSKHEEVAYIGTKDRGIKGVPPRIAIQAHVFYPELMDQVQQYLKNLDLPYDLYISTTTEEKKKAIVAYARNRIHANKLVVEVFDNRGRDVAPFILQMHKRAEDYDFICHIHTKRSLHSAMGDDWRTYLLDNLLGSKKIVHEIFDRFEQDDKLGIIFPENYDVIRPFVEWGAENKTYAKALLKRMNCRIDLPDEILFPAGDMLWMRTKAVEKLFRLNWSERDFPPEEGQVDCTIMHAIERLWLYIAKENGYGYQMTRSFTDQRPLEL